MSADSPLSKAVTVAPGIRMRMHKNERGEPVIQVCTITSFAAGEVHDVELLGELNELYRFLGSAIAQLRATNFSNRTSP